MCIVEPKRLMLYIYFCRNENGMACTLDTLDTKCKGDIPECCGQFGWVLDRIVTLAGDVDDLPTVPEEARRRYAEATELLKKHHASKEDGLNGSYKFHEVLRYAPWWRDIYYNNANALALAGYYCSARRDLHRYIATKPSEAEVRDAQNRIAEIDRLEASER